MIIVAILSIKFVAKEYKVSTSHSERGNGNSESFVVDVSLINTAKKDEPGFQPVKMKNMDGSGDNECEILPYQ